MCLKYFVRHSTCDHHEYLGSHHCSDIPCDLDRQHLHYIEDSFPIPWSSSLQLNFQTERSALACTTCANKLRNKLNPDELPVQLCAPANNLHVKEIRPPGHALPIRVVEAEAEDVQTEEGDGDDSNDSNDSNDHYDYDYKSLSDADEDEWKPLEPGQATESRVVYTALMHRDSAYVQLEGLPNYLARQWQTVPCVPIEHWPEAYAKGDWLHHPMPRTMHIAPSPMLFLQQWAEDTHSLYPVSTGAFSSHPDESAPQPLLVPRDTATPTTPAVLPQRPSMPPSTPPFMVGSFTDAYFRIEAAKKRRMHERDRQAMWSLRDALPARSMALTDFVVKKRHRKGHHKNMKALEELEDATWLSLPFAGGESDSEGGAEEFAEIVEIEGDK